MDFTLTPEQDKLRLEIRDFVDTEMIPLEKDVNIYNAHENINEDALRALRQKAKDRGLWSIQMPVERGGRGQNMVGMAACYEEMNRSIFGPVVFNSAAPDDGNMMVLNKIATDEQKERWLQPIIDGTINSSFVMTEPAPGSGSDPSMMLTTATRQGDGWVINGLKHFITGAGGAGYSATSCTSGRAHRGYDPRRNLAGNDVG